MTVIRAPLGDGFSIRGSIHTSICVGDGQRRFALAQPQAMSFSARVCVILVELKPHLEALSSTGLDLQCVDTVCIKATLTARLR